MIFSFYQSRKSEKTRNEKIMTFMAFWKISFKTLKKHCKNHLIENSSFASNIIFYWLQIKIKCDIAKPTRVFMCLSLNWLLELKINWDVFHAEQQQLEPFFTTCFHNSTYHKVNILCLLRWSFTREFVFIRQILSCLKFVHCMISVDLHKNVFLLLFFWNF